MTGVKSFNWVLDLPCVWGMVGPINGFHLNLCPRASCHWWTSIRFPARNDQRSHSSVLRPMENVRFRFVALESWPKMHWVRGIRIFFSSTLQAWQWQRHMWLDAWGCAIVFITFRTHFSVLKIVTSSGLGQLFLEDEKQGREWSNARRSSQFTCTAPCSDFPVRNAARTTVVTNKSYLNTISKHNI